MPAKKPAKPVLPQDVLPAGIVAKDLERNYKIEGAYKALKEAGAEDLWQLKFYYTERFGWVLTTLHISNARQGSKHQTERSYGITVKDEELVTVGRGPHVLRVLEVNLNVENIERLRVYVELWKKGMAKAGDTRDRISTRRAQTSMRRRGFGFGGLFS